MADTAPTTRAPGGARDSDHTDDTSDRAAKITIAAGHICALAQALSMSVSTILAAMDGPEQSILQTILHLVEEKAEGIEREATAIQEGCYRKARLALAT